MSEQNTDSSVQINTQKSNSTPVHKHRLIVGGEKGGVGKTWFTYLLIELLYRLNLDPTILDLDKTTPNVAKAYLKDIYKQWVGIGQQQDRMFAPVKETGTGKENPTARLKKLLSHQIVLSNNPDDTHTRDRLSEIIELSDHIVISLPAQSQPGLCYWLNETDLVASEINPQIVLFWVSDGSYESLNLLEHFMYEYPDLHYCLVINKGIGATSKWENYQLGIVNPDLNQAIAKGELKAIIIEKVLLSDDLAIRIQKEGLTFSEIIADRHANQRLVFRLKTWLESSFKTIKSTGYI